MSRRSLHRIMKSLKFRVYRPVLLQELRQTDHALRVKFCEWYLIMNDCDPNFARSILWSDEAQLKLNGRVNRYNCIYWADENPHLILEKEVNATRVIVWAGISERGTIGPYFFDMNVNQKSYLELLMELRQTLNEDERFADIDAILQQDSTPAHWGIEVRNYLNANFPDWIGRGGRTAYPPRSPDLTLMDFSVWSILKDRVFVRTNNNLEELKANIIEEFDFINEDLELLNRMVNANVKRYMKCIEMDGQYFEHLLIKEKFSLILLK